MRAVDPVTIHLLGGFRMMVGTRPVPDRAWRLRKAQLVVQLLALTPGHALHREQVMEWLWPDLSPAAAARNLHQAVHAARRALAAPGDPGGQDAPDPSIQLRQQVVRLQPPGGLWVDSIAFEEAAAAARRRGDPAAYARALALYEGDLLPESPYDEILAGPRRRLRELRLALQLEMADLAEAAGDWHAALEAYRAILDADPTVEQAVAGMMRACIALDARDEAARRFRAYTRELRDQLGLEPDPDVLRLYRRAVDRSDHGAAAARHGRDDAVIRGDRPPASPPVLDRQAARAASLPLVGRSRELGLLARALETRSRGSLFVITGEPGIGKSRLAREACRVAAALGIPAAAGFGTGDGETPPFGPWRQVIHEYAARTGRSRQGLPAPLGEAPPAASTHDLALDVAEFLLQGPAAILVLEDLHWFDPGSLDLLRQALPRLIQGPLHLLATVRTRDLQDSEPIRHAVQALLRAGAEHLELGRLDRDAVAALARAAGRPDRAQVVYERSSGHTYFACQLLTATDGDLPWTVRQAIVERLARLDPDPVALLRVAALLGRKFTAEALAATAGVGSPEVEEALRAALGEGILQRQGRGYVFDHDLIRETLVEDLDPAERAALHRRAAAAVDEPDAAAYHLDAAGDPAAVPLLLDAGRRALEWGAVDQAYRHLDRALHLAGADDPLRPEILLLMAVHGDVAELPRRQRLLEIAVAEAERLEDPLVTALAQRLLAEVLATRNDARALDLFAQAETHLAQVEDDPRCRRLEALLDRRILLYPGLPTLMYALTRHSRGGDPVAAAEAAVKRRRGRSRSHEDRLALAFAHIIKGDAAGAVEHMIAGGERAMAARSYVTATWCLATALNVLLLQFGTDRAAIAAVTERMREAAAGARQRTGTDPFPGDTFMLHYWYWYGQWDRVRRAYDAFVAAGGVVTGTVTDFVYTFGAEVLREQGDARAALQVYAGLLPPGGPGSPPGVTHYMVEMAYITLAVRTMIAAGELEMARAWLETADAWHRGPRPSLVNHGWTLVEWAEWHRARGDIPAMRQAALEALDLARRAPATSVEYNAHRLLGAAGGPEAPDHLARALDLAQRCGYPFDIARALLERGRPEDLLEARRIFESLGARPYLQRVDEALAAQG